jgi:hypothetical protein
MKLALTFAILLTLMPPEASAQPSHGTFWTRIPTVTVVAAIESDPRLPLVRDAVDFWNRTFAEIGSPFRLGRVVVMTGEVPIGDPRSAQPDGRRPSVAAPPGDLIIALVRWYSRFGSRRRVPTWWHIHTPDPRSQFKRDCGRLS